MKLKSTFLRTASCVLASAMMAGMILTACGGGGTPSSSSKPSSGTSGKPASSSSGTASSGSSKPAGSSGSGSISSSNSTDSSSSGGTSVLSSRTAKFFASINKEKVYFDVDVFSMTNSTQKENVIAAIDGNKDYFAGEISGVNKVTISNGKRDYTLILEDKVAIDYGEWDSGADYLGELLISQLIPQNYMLKELVPGTTIVDNKSYYSESYTLIHGLSEKGKVSSTYTFCFDGNNLVYEVYTVDDTEKSSSIAYKINKIVADFDESIFELPSDYKIMTLNEYGIAKNNGTL